MLNTIFKNIAQEENADLEIVEDVVSYSDGSRSPHLIYKMYIPYKGCTIHFVNKTGTEFYGIVVSNFPKKMENLEFEISVRSHFISLFTTKIDRIRLDTKSALVSSFFKQSSAFKTLSQISESTVFEPSIIGANNEDIFNVTTKYSLQFSDWTKSIKPIIQLQKQFIDFFI
ncbi:hypothetical protein [uncultured Psychroserpens sp.]|uniref:hypothetical protein n=1 Tax=uncultured Psychroserpens sp. TaxID=255436 RepID=UPI00260ADDC7|nr:hypothetical protein [uncultured Psychroserpens sp.]